MLLIENMFDKISQLADTVKFCSFACGGKKKTNKQWRRKIGIHAMCEITDSITRRAARSSSLPLMLIQHAESDKTAADKRPTGATKTVGDVW